MSIRIKITVMFLSVALIPLLVVSALTFMNYKNSLEAARLTELQNIAAFKADKIETYFGGLKTCAVIVQSAYIIKKYFPVLRKFAHDQTNQEFLAAREIVSRTSQNTQAAMKVSDIMLVGPDGRVVCANNPRHYGRDLSRGIDAEKQAFIQGKEKIFLSNIYFDKEENKRFEMLVTAPAFDLNNTFVGVIALEVDMEHMYWLIQDVTGLGKTGETLLGKKTGTEVLFLNPLRYDSDAALKRRVTLGDKNAIGIQSAAQGKTGAGQFIDYRGKDVVGAWRYVPSLNWGIVAKIDADEAFVDVVKLRNLVGIILVIICILACVMAFSIARSISGPIKKLSQGVEIIGRGNLDHTVATAQQDEIGQLSRSFDQMVRDLKKTTASRDELNSEIAERRQIEKALWESEERYRSFVEASAQIVWTTNDAGEVVMDIPSWQAYTGQSADEARGLGWMNAVHPDDRERVAGAWRKASSSRSLYEVEYLLRVHDGSWRNILARGVPVVEDDGSVREYVGTCIDITEKKQAEEALRQSEIKYRTVADNTYDWEFWLDPDGRFIYCSPSCERITGHKPEEFLADPDLCPRLIHPDDRPHVERHILEVEQKQKSGEEAVMRYVRPDGSSCWVAHICQPVYNDSGRFIGTRCSNRDITERKKSEDALFESEQYRSAVFRASPTGIFITRLSDGLFLEANEAYLKMLGYSIDEIIGHNALELNIWVNNEGRKRVVSILHEQGHLENGEAKFRSKNGDIVDVLYSALLLERRGEQCILGTLTDISALKQIERMLQQQRKELQIILDSVQAMVFYKDTENRFVRTNKAFEDAMGAAKEELENKSLFDIYSADQAEAYWRDDKEVMSTGRAKRGIIEPMPTPTGTRLLLTDKIPYVDESGRVIGVIGCSIDITELKKTEKELTQSNRDLEQFAYVASHDLQEPLRIVTSYVQLLEKRYKDRLDKDANVFIAYAVDGAKRMRDLINDLLEFSRVGTQERSFDRIDCNTALNQAIKNLDLIIQDSGAKVAYDKLPAVIADNRQLIQLFQNLINNAIKFRGQEKPRVTVSAEKRTSEWLFVVKDNGIGIAPEFLERIFIIFQRLHGRDKYPGTGIGLAICQRIVEHHGGRIWVESEPGKGAQFYFTIPEV